VGNDSGCRAAIDGVAESEQANERLGDSQSASKNNRGLTRKPRISEEPLKKRKKTERGEAKIPISSKWSYATRSRYTFNGHKLSF
jgi:hypothetical protein